MLFEPIIPNSPALWAVLEGKCGGKSLVDDQDRPRQCVLRTDAFLTYFGSYTGKKFLDQAITRFKKAGSIWLVWPVAPNLNPPLIEEAKVVNRLEFINCDPDSKTLVDLRNSLPKGCTIQQMDRNLFQQCNWRPEMVHYAGSESNFQKYGIGLCLLQDNKILVEAYASAMGNQKAEIGAITRKNYRGNGYAPIACAYLIEACRQRRCHVIWSCETDHQASILVAQKLGFQSERGYTIYEYK
jgi:hypothetical protein